MKENYVYPILIEKQDGILVITLPDFEGEMTEAENEEEAIRSAQELIALCIMDYEDRGVQLPKPSEHIELADNENKKVIYVNIWMPYFRTITKVVYVKKTLTIPSWLDVLAKERNVNFSAILVDALKKELGLDK